MDNKQIQRKRMMSYFIRAAEQIIETEGIDKITIRKVAHLAAYNSATLYNYFEDLDHLVFYTLMKYMKNYTLSLSAAISTCNTAREMVITNWKVFSHYAFSNPKIFYNLFFNKRGDKFSEVLEEYYTIFPEDLGEHKDFISVMLKQSDIFRRNETILLLLLPESHRDPAIVDKANRLMVYTLQALLISSFTGLSDATPEGLSEEMMSMVQFLIGTIPTVTA